MTDPHRCTCKGILWRPPEKLPENLSPRERSALAYLKESSAPREGRRYALRELAHAMAFLGATNHQIVVALEDRADAWGVLPRTNSWARYSYILGQIADARTALRSTEDGLTQR